MRLATWNVNSIRSRADRVAAWLERSDVDVVALQETKCRDDQFPEMMFNAIGYEVAHVGYSQWNGVAILSRVGIEDVQIGFPGQPTWGETPAEEARALGATCGGVRVWSLYVPNGRTLADPHYQYKLDWLAALRTTAAGWLAEDPAAQVALVGDWNIAPEDDDVWDMAVFAHSTHVSPPERAAFGPSSRPGSPTSSGRTRRARASTRTGTTRSCASPAARACGSTSSSAPPRWPAGSPARGSTARSARARAPATTPP